MQQKSGLKSKGLASLGELARFWGIQTAYVDVKGRRQIADAESLMAALWALGASLSRLEDAPQSLTESRQAHWNTRLDPVGVTWDGKGTRVSVRLPPGSRPQRLQATVTLENGEPISPHQHQLKIEEWSQDAETGCLMAGLNLPRLPWGYHHLVVEGEGWSAESLIISSPRRPAPLDRRDWGVFMPLYALRSSRSAGIGDLADMDALLDWTTKLGGATVATLPLFSAFLDEPFEPSPYSPVSRLFWNELYLPLERLPEYSRSPEAKTAVSGEGYGQTRDALEKEQLVDYRRAMRLKRDALEPMARLFFQEGGEEHQRMRSFLNSSPHAREYALFRAKVEEQGAFWQDWPAEACASKEPISRRQQESYQYHLYAQMAFQEQLSHVVDKYRGKAGGLLLDLPVGSHGGGFDTWRWKELFVPSMSTGAPPDSLFTGGQNWGFPPLHPQKIREEGYKYFRGCLNNLFSFASAVRLDHVMGFHRLFWVPAGMEATRGVYIRYPSEEIYAILTLEAQRHKVLLQGEDLGTVPAEVRKSMERHGMCRSYVVQHYLRPSNLPPSDPKPLSVAVVNTHDMPTFAAFFKGRDVDNRVTLGFLPDDESEDEKSARRAVLKELEGWLCQQGLLYNEGPEDAMQVLRAILGFLGESPSRLVVVSLEDLWLEEQPLNIPGTSTEFPNWRRKARHDFESFSSMPSVISTLKKLDDSRKIKKGAPNG